MEKMALPAGIIVMRHGRREDADNPLWQSTARFPFDTPLKEYEDEILESAARIQQSGTSIDVVYTSPFRRCVETSERILRALGRQDVPVFIHRGLSEVHNPRLLFRARAATLSQTARLWLWRATYRQHSRPLRSRFGIKARLLDSAWPQLPESELRASLRFHDTILQLAARHPGQHVLVVSHGRAVQVAHEALGVIGRALQVSYAGFVACRARQAPPLQQQQEQQDEAQDQAQQQEHQQEEQRLGDPVGVAAAGARELRWEDFELDPGAGCFGVESSYHGLKDH